VPLFGSLAATGDLLGPYRLVDRDGGRRSSTSGPLYETCSRMPGGPGSPRTSEHGKRSGESEDNLDKDADLELDLLSKVPAPHTLVGPSASCDSRLFGIIPLLRNAKLGT